MERITKEQLEKRLADNLERQEIYATIREGVAKFKHYKQVNKRFTDYLDTQGVSAWIKSGAWPELVVRKKNYENRVIIYGKYDNKLTWEVIENYVKDHKLQEYEQEIRKQISDLETDKSTLKTLCDIIMQYRESVSNYRYELDRFAKDLEWATK